PLHDVAAGGGNENAMPLVSGDEVTGAGRRPADGIVRAVDKHPIQGIPEGLRARGVRADVVALDHHARVAPGDQDASLRVARDEVAGSGRRTPDEGALITNEEYAAAAVAHGESAGGVGADVVPLNHSPPSGVNDAVPSVSGNEVTGPGGRTS